MREVKFIECLGDLSVQNTGTCNSMYKYVLLIFRHISSENIDLGTVSKNFGGGVL